MAIGADTLNLLFRISGDSAEGRKASQELQEAIERDLQKTVAETVRTNKEIEKSEKSVQAERVRTQKATEKAAREAEREAKRAAAEIKKAYSTIGDGLSRAGQSLTVALSVPLAAIASLGVSSALEIDKVRTKITALVGDSEKANQKIAELRNLASGSVGVLQQSALESYAQLKGIGGIADETINKVIVSMGKLNAAFNIEDQAGFIQNLNQIFNQSFERSDIKEAIGRVPFFEQLLESAFGTKDGEKLRQLKAAGKLTLDSFLTGMSEAIATDSRLANIGESLSVKVAKSAERLNVALAPIGDIILGLVVPAIEAVAPYIQQLSEYFKSLSPTIQTVVVAVGALLGALGPGLVIIAGFASAVSAIGAFVSAVGTAVAALGGFTVVLPVLAAVTIAIGELIAIGAALYLAWQSDFGGIQTFTLQVFNTVKTIISGAMAEVYADLQLVGGRIVSWWRENYPLIEQTVKTVSDVIKGTIQAFLEVIRGFWDSYGEQIMSVVRTVWNTVKDIITTATNQIGQFVKIGMQAINGDWSGAWQTFQKIISNAVEVVVRYLRGMISATTQVLVSLISAVIRYGSQFQVTIVEYAVKAVAGFIYVIATLPQRITAIIPSLIRAGMSIGAAVWEGIKRGLSDGVSAGFSADSGAFGSSNNIPSRAGLEGTTNTVTTGGGGKGGKSGAGKAEREREKQLGDQLESFNLAEKAAKDDYEAFKKTLEMQLDAGTVALDEYKRKLTEQIDIYYAAIAQAFQGKKSILAQRFKGVELANELEKARQEISKVEADISEDSLRADLGIAERKKKNREIAAKGEIDLIKSSSETQLDWLEIAYKQGDILAVESAEGRISAEERYAKKVGEIKLGVIESEIAVLNTLEQTAEVINRIKLLDEERTRQMIENAEKLKAVYEAGVSGTGSATNRSNEPGGDVVIGINDPAEATGGAFGGLFDSFLGGLDDLAEGADRWTGIGQIMADSFNGIAQAVGNSVKAFVLFGSAGGSFKKFAAEMLASIAQMAAVQAIFELAQGFAMLALAYFGHPMAGPSATQHFIAAGVYGAIAGVAAIAGRAVAGDSFKQNNAGQAAFSSSASQATGGGRQTPENDEAQIISLGRNAPSGNYSNNRNEAIRNMFDSRHELTVNVRSKDSHIVEVLEEDYQNNGKFTKLVLKIADE